MSAVKNGTKLRLPCKVAWSLNPCIFWYWALPSALPGEAMQRLLGKVQCPPLVRISAGASLNPTVLSIGAVQAVMDLAAACGSSEIRCQCNCIPHITYLWELPC